MEKTYFGKNIQGSFQNLPINSKKRFMLLVQLCTQTLRLCKGPIFYQIELNLTKLYLQNRRIWAWNESNQNGA